MTAQLLDKSLIPKDARNSALEKRAYKRLMEKVSGDDTTGNTARLKQYLADKDQSGLNSVQDRLLRSAANDIFPVPPCLNPARREATRYDLKLWNTTYFPNRYPIAFSPDHDILINTTQSAILHGGGLFANALPRGHGKSTNAETAGLWATFHGHKKYLLLVAATGGHAKEMHQSIFIEILTNELLLEDFPEIVYPVIQLNNNPSRNKYQHCSGRPTYITITSEKFVFPSLTESKVSGSVIDCAAITGRMRGRKYTTSEGESLRPDLVIVDDPQTDRSARSPNMTAQREKIIQGTIKGLAAPTVPITVIMPCTVIQKNDLSERFLDRSRRPEWQGQRAKLLPKFPDNMELWGQYQQVRSDSFIKGDQGKEATTFYAANREAMDAGAVVSWAERFYPHQLSAIQYAMDLYIDDPVAFASEYQNDPLPDVLGDGTPRIELEAKKILERFNNSQPGIVPLGTQFITTGVDMQGKIVYYVTCAWGENFSGAIVAYGTYPKQFRDYFIAADPPDPISKHFPNLELGPQLYQALNQLKEQHFGMRFKRDEIGDEIGISKILIDANWNLSADAVYSFCKENQTGERFHPVHGKGVSAAQLPFDQFGKAGCIKRGHNWMWRISKQASNKGRHISYDTNFWKSLVAERLVNPKGSSSALLLGGRNSIKHQMLADHLASEQPITTQGRGRTVDEWKLKPAQENHYFDCLVMSAVAASFSGLNPHVVTEDDSGTIVTKEYKIQGRKKADMSKAVNRKQNV